MLKLGVIKKERKDGSVIIIKDKTIIIFCKTIRKSIIDNHCYVIKGNHDDLWKKKILMQWKCKKEGKNEITKDKKTDRGESEICKQDRFEDCCNDWIKLLLSSMLPCTGTWIGPPTAMEWWVEGGQSEVQWYTVCWCCGGCVCEGISSTISYCAYMESRREVKITSLS